MEVNELSLAMTLEPKCVVCKEDWKETVEETLRVRFLRLFHNVIIP